MRPLAKAFHCFCRFKEQILHGDLAILSVFLIVSKLLIDLSAGG